LRIFQVLQLELEQKLEKSGKGTREEEETVEGKETRKKKRLERKRL
jgi:hypothetical protein